LGVINTAGFGILFGFALLRTHDLWLPIGIHSAGTPHYPGSGWTQWTYNQSDKVSTGMDDWKPLERRRLRTRSESFASAILVILFVLVWRIPVRRGSTYLLDAEPDPNLWPDTPDFNDADSASRRVAASAGVLHPADKLTDDEKIGLVAT